MGYVELCNYLKLGVGVCQVSNGLRSLDSILDDRLAVWTTTTTRQVSNELLF
jgi:hypothetical protein